MQKERPRILLASQCFFQAYHAQKKVPGIPAMTWDFVNSTSKAISRKEKTQVITFTKPHPNIRREKGIAKKVNLRTIHLK